MSAPAWFENAVTSGLQALYVLSLQDRPAADTLDYTCDVWLQTLLHNRLWAEDDAWRIEAAFKRMMQTCTRWPAPPDFLKALPAREQRRLPELFTAEQRAKNIARLRAERNALLKK